MIKNGRQAAPTLDGIRDDHKERYKLAIAEIDKLGISRVMDVGCGVGYGSYMMANHGHIVDAFEIEQEVIDYGDQFYSHPNLVRFCRDLASITAEDAKEFGTKALTMFEIIEHTTEAPEFLKRMAGVAKILIGSVPNEDLVPFGPDVHRQHVRHYRPSEIQQTLEDAGWEVVKIGCQTGKHGKSGECRFDRTDGRTLVFVAKS